MADEYKGRYAKFINTMQDGKAKSYLTERIVPQMDYYSKNSALNQKRYRQFSVLSIIFNGVIPVVVLFGDLDGFSFAVKLIVAVLSSAAGILSAIAALMNFRELWVQYRVSLELLKSVMDRYFLCVGEFEGKDYEGNLGTLQQLCEEIMTREHNLWKEAKLEGGKAQ